MNQVDATTNQVGETMGKVDATITEVEATIAALGWACTVDRMPGNLYRATIENQFSEAQYVCVEATGEDAIHGALISAVVNLGTSEKSETVPHSSGPAEE
jgi:hypothetical protein